MRNDISVFVYTNERGFNITYLTVPKVVNAFKEVVENIYVVANKLPSQRDHDYVKYIDASVEFCGSGRHFSQTLQVALKQIKEDYVLFLCDDYFFKSQVKQNVFNSIVDLIKDNDVDYFSFSSLCYCDVIIKDWKTPNLNLEKYNLTGTLLEISENYRHLYSVQPCIWKKSSLLKVLEHNPNLSLWDMDNSSLCNTKQNCRTLNYETNMYLNDEENRLDYNFKNYTINLPPLTYNIDNRVPDSDFYVFDYGEIIRHGKFVDTMTNTKRLVLDYIEKDQALQEKLKNFIY
jgi:hypothetical protein